MIRFQDVTFGYGLRRPVIEHLDLVIPDAGRIALSGPSGTGKTTVLRLLCGLEHPRRGEVSGTDGLGISAVFQEDRLLPWLTALENVTLFAEREESRRILDALGLGEAENAYPSELSGGMKRRCALARALAHPFDLLVLDEAFTGLDAAAKETAFAEIRKRLDGKMLVMTAHDLSEAEALGASVIKIAGRNV